jgi:hypothetical protein
LFSRSSSIGWRTAPHESQILNFWIQLGCIPSIIYGIKLKLSFERLVSSPYQVLDRLEFDIFLISRLKKKAQSRGKKSEADEKEKEYIYIYEN